MSGAGVDSMGIQGQGKNFYFLEGRTPKPLTLKEQQELDGLTNQNDLPFSYQTKHRQRPAVTPTSLHTVKKIKGFEPGAGHFEIPKSEVRPVPIRQTSPYRASSVQGQDMNKLVNGLSAAEQTDEKDEFARACQAIILDSEIKPNGTDRGQEFTYKQAKNIGFNNYKANLREQHASEARMNHLKQKEVEMQRKMQRALHLASNLDAFNKRKQSDLDFKRDYRSAVESHTSDLRSKYNQSKEDMARRKFELNEHLQNRKIQAFNEAKLKREKDEQDQRDKQALIVQEKRDKKEMVQAWEARHEQKLKNYVKSQEQANLESHRKRLAQVNEETSKVRKVIELGQQVEFETVDKVQKSMIKESQILQSGRIKEITEIMQSETKAISVPQIFSGRARAERLGLQPKATKTTPKQDEQSKKISIMNIEASVDVTRLSPEIKKAGRYQVNKTIQPKSSTKPPVKPIKV